MRQTILLILLLLLPLTALARKHTTADKVRFFARYESSCEGVVVGDSAVVNLVLYSDRPFDDVRLRSAVKVSGGHYRLVTPRGKRQQQRVRLDDGVYYAVVWQQIVVGSDRVEDLRFSKVRCEGTFIIYEDQYDYTPMDPFGFFSQPRQKYHTVRARCHSSAYKFRVTPRPKRSTREVLSSGGQVA